MQPDPKKWFIEPFAGGMNLTSLWHGVRWANDADPELIEMWWYVLSKGYVPYVSKDHYNYVRKNPRHVPRWKVGLAAYVYSYRGKKWGGYARTVTSKDGGIRDYAREAQNNMQRQLESLFPVLVTNYHYADMELPDADSCLIYCDPPYAETTGYRSDFDTPAFWNWVRNLSVNGYTVYTSEYNAPEDFECVWEKGVRMSLHNTGDKPVRTHTERLWKYAGNI